MILPATPPPFPTESLNGYLLRLAELNGYGNLAVLHKVAGNKGVPLSFRPGSGDLLAPLVGLTSEQFQNFAYERGSTAADRKRSSFLGHPVLASMIDEQGLKICPACIRDAWLLQQPVGSVGLHCLS